MKLIFLCGLPGVGKLTVAREVSALNGYRLFHNHLVVDLVESVFEFGSEPFVELREKVWLEVFTTAAKHELEGMIFTFAFDRTVSEHFVRDVSELVESGGGEILFVELTSSPDELEKRIGEPSRREFGKLNSVEQFRELEESDSFPVPDLPRDRLILDTTNLSPREAADVIVGASHRARD